MAVLVKRYHTGVLLDSCTTLLPTTIELFYYTTILLYRRGARGRGRPREAVPHGRRRPARHRRARAAAGSKWRQPYLTTRLLYDIRKIVLPRAVRSAEAGL